tara:strand:+ start:91 stop:801 length:711 start_codon:yes stop_codon:yes gene_type:complete
VKLILFIISFFDNFNKKKIVNFFLKRKRNYNVVIDVGAHKAETIKLFNKFFQVESIYSFEASEENFKYLQKKIKNLNNTKVYNFALGSANETKKFYHLRESSSSTLVKLNKNSKYYKKKNRILNLFRFSPDIKDEYELNIKTLENFLNTENISYVDILKIDTEGYEFEVIKGTKERIKDIKYIYFEHHFDDMLVKNYKLSDIHNYLLSNGFKKKLKIKMFFRKTFEYIYENENLKI